MKVVSQDDVRGAQRIGYRRDIDGLRATSVLTVVLFHSFPNLVRGGFVGVDVFFLISGFLITGIISKSIEHNNFSIVWFYGQRILSIFPSLIVVLAAAYAFGWMSLYADEFKRLALHIIGGATFTANIVLWTETGYFDVDAATKPLLHLWSLGVEEQFYILWPLLLVVGKYLRVPAAAAIALLAAVSFAIEIASIGAHPMAAFFLPFGRMWELAAGGLLAVAWGKFSLRAPAANLASVAGFAAIVGAALLLREGQDFPGWRAAIPVGGAAAVIAAGSNAWVNQSILQRSWLVGLGRISYPLYLWHWVLFSFSTVLVGGPPFWASRLCLLALSLVASWTSYFFVERWCRNGRGANVKAVGLCVAMLAFIAAAFITWKRDGLDFRRGSSPFADVATASLGRGRELAEQRCLVAASEYQDPFFCLSDRREPARVLLWGDSKAEPLYYGMLLASSPGRRWSLVGRWGCPPFFAAGFSTGPGSGFCASLDASIGRAHVRGEEFSERSFCALWRRQRCGAVRAPVGRDHRRAAAPRQESGTGDGQPGSARSARLYGSRCLGMERGSHDPRGRAYGGADHAMRFAPGGPPERNSWLPGVDRGNRCAAPRPRCLRSDARSLRLRAWNLPDGRQPELFILVRKSHFRFGRRAHRLTAAASGRTPEIRFCVQDHEDPARF